MNRYSPGFKGPTVKLTRALGVTSSFTCKSLLSNSSLVESRLTKSIHAFCPGAKLLVARTAGRLKGLRTLIGEAPLGAPRREGFATFGYAASVTRRTVGPLRVGVEAFGELGSDHRFPGRAGAYVGPQIDRRSPALKLESLFNG